MFGAIISLNLSYGKCVGAERVVGTKAAESCRVVQGNSRESDEVHSVSSVLKASRHNGCDRYIAEAFQALWFSPGCEVNKAHSAKNARNRVVTRIFLRPCIVAGTFLFF